jgi:hypothetical protein
VEPDEALIARRTPDGGFGIVTGMPSEPEPTAMVALALDDQVARDWIEDHQRADGAVGVEAGTVFRDLTALGLLAMRSPERIATATAHILASPARSEPETDALPHDPDARGWSWTTDTFGWAEPTAWAVLALRSVGELGSGVEDGIDMLRDREAVGGGWNYGNRIVLGEELPAFVQPTAVALLALHGVDDPIVDRGLTWLEASWERESDGLLSVAAAAAALRRYRHPSAAAAATSLRDRLDAVDDPDTIALAWACIALGDGLSRLEVP